MKVLSLLLVLTLLGCSSPTAPSCEADLGSRAEWGFYDTGCPSSEDRITPAGDSLRVSH